MKMPGQDLGEFFAAPLLAQFDHEPVLFVGDGQSSPLSEPQVPFGHSPQPIERSLHGRR